MARVKQPVCRICRREGDKLFLKGERCFSPKCAMVKRPYPPGVHGQSRRRGSPSEFSEQLREKQKAKRLYGLSEKQFHIYYERAAKKAGATGELLLKLLELRLDNVVIRSGLAESRKQARQMISHGLIKVNDRTVTIASFSVPVGAQIQLSSKEDSDLMRKFKERAEKIKTPNWISLDAKNAKSEVTSELNTDELDVGIQAQLIVEFYSR